MKHMMRLEIIDPIVGAFQTERAGWEHADQIANGRSVRLVQSRQVDQDQTELRDLKESTYEVEPQNGEGVVVGVVIIIFAFVGGLVVGWFVGGMR